MAKTFLEHSDALAKSIPAKEVKFSSILQQGRFAFTFIAVCLVFLLGPILVGGITKLDNKGLKSILPS